MQNILNNLLAIEDEVKNLCIQAGRGEHDCLVLPVTKTVDPSVLEFLCRNSKNIFGENKIQEMKSKHEFLKDLNPQWHFIGHLQTNKVKDCLRFSSFIHSVDRIELAIALDKELQKQGRSIEILIQVNTSDEASKFGVSVDKAMGLIKDVSQFDALKIKGLMTLAAFTEDKVIVRSCFKNLKQIFEQAKSLDKVEMQHLSMGMSSDYKIAIEEGATIVRVGQSIFGARKTPDSFYWNENKKV